MEGCSYRVSSTNCCVVGCGNNYSNTDKTIKFYCFPSRPYEVERRKLWIHAVGRNKSSGSQSKPWEPRSHSRICSKHFINNKKSNHPQNPAFIPTIFPEVYKKKNTENKVKVRFDRLQARNKLKKSAESNQITQNDNFCEVLEIDEQLNTNVKTTVDSSCQVNISTNYFNGSFLFESEFQGNNEVATSCNITYQNHFKSYAEKNVGPDVDEEICKGFHGSSSISTDDQLGSVTGVNFAVFLHILRLLHVTAHGNDKVDIKNSRF